MRESGHLEWPTTDLVSHRTVATPQRTALIDADRDETWTFRTYDRHVDDALAGLQDVGGGTIGTLLDTRPAFASVFFAAMRSGSTLVPLNVRETSRELSSKIERTDLDVIVCESETESRALEVAGRDQQVYSVDRIGETEDVRPVFKTGNAVPEPTAIGRETTQLIMFTSGTSGDPKGVRLTVGNLVSSATSSAFRLGVRPDDRWLCCLPMYHMGGLAPVVRSALYGTTVVVQRSFDARETAHVIDSFDITGISLVPTMLHRLLEGGWSPPDGLRFVLLGGAPASHDLLERCEREGVPVYPTYGMTETASQIATATPEMVSSKPETVGQSLAFTDVTVVNDDGDPVPAGELGELVVDGPTVTPGYLEDSQTDAAFGPHGLSTGDVGYRDEDGALWVVNRRSDRIVTGGENVDPGEVLEVIRSHPAVRSAAIVGLPNDEWGERVGALVVPADSRSEAVDVASLLDHCRDRLAGFKLPKTVVFADQLPRTVSGTVDRAAVANRLEEDGIDVSSR